MGSSFKCGLFRASQGRPTSCALSQYRPAHQTRVFVLESWGARAHRIHGSLLDSLIEIPPSLCDQGCVVCLESPLPITARFARRQRRSPAICKWEIVGQFQPGGMAGGRASPPCRASTENAHSAGLWREGPALAQGPISCARARCRRAPHHNGAAGWAGKAHPAARGHSTLSWAAVRRRRQADATCRAPSGTMHTPRFGDPEGGPGAPAHFRALRERHGGTHQRFSCSSRQPGSALAGPQTQHRQCQWSLRSQHRHEVLPSGAPRRLHLRDRTSPDVSEG